MWSYSTQTNPNKMICADRYKWDIWLFWLTFGRVKAWNYSCLFLFCTHSIITSDKKLSACGSKHSQKFYIVPSCLWGFMSCHITHVTEITNETFMCVHIKSECCVESSSTSRGGFPPWTSAKIIVGKKKKRFLRARTRFLFLQHSIKTTGRLSEWCIACCIYRTDVGEWDGENCSLNSCRETQSTRIDFKSMPCIYYKVKMWGG